MNLSLHIEMTQSPMNLQMQQNSSTGSTLNLGRIEIIWQIFLHKILFIDLQNV